jgi:phage tail protein X
MLLKWGAVSPALLLLAAGVFLILPHFQTGMNSPAPPREYQTRLSPGAEEPVHSQGDGLKARIVENEPAGGNARAGTAAGDSPLPQKEMPQEKKSDTVRIVKRGDTLYRMVQDVYGSSDYGLIKHVRNSNPGIKDVNEIKAGEEIRFPEIPVKKVEGRQ